MRTESAVLDAPLLGPIQTKCYRVLICDDQADVCDAMALLLKSEGHRAMTVRTPGDLLNAIRRERFDLILADLNYTRDTTSGDEGLDLLQALETEGNRTPVIVMTAWGSIGLAVEAVKRGACDFIEKPWDNQRVMKAVRAYAGGHRQRETELETATEVQQRMLPAAVNRTETIEYAGRCVAAKGVAGDYFDFLRIDESTIGIVMADVAGKGLPAALLMANLQAAFRSQDPEVLRHPASLMKIVNRHFYETTGAERFATVFYATYCERTRRLRYVNCAHCAPLLLRAEGGMQRLDATATLVGAFANWNGMGAAIEASVTLGHGDALVLYSDGVPEAIDRNGEEFGDERLEQLIRQGAGASAEAMVAVTIDAVLRFSQGSTRDDVTVAAVRGL